MEPTSSSPLERALKIVLGVLVFVAGVAMLVLPGPGLLAMAGGAALAASQLPQGRRLIARVRIWARERTDPDRVRSVEQRLPSEIVPRDDTEQIRRVADLAYHDYLTEELPNHELLGETIREQFRYFPTVTREDFRHRGRLTELLTDGTIPGTFGLPPLNAETDRAMLCGGPSMLAEFRDILDNRGFQASKHIGDVGQYVFERAFVEH